jgi:hypothetical protein
MSLVKCALVREVFLYERHIIKRIQMQILIISYDEHNIRFFRRCQMRPRH